MKCLNPIFNLHDFGCRPNFPRQPFNIFFDISHRHFFQVIGMFRYKCLDNDALSIPHRFSEFRWIQSQASNIIVLGGEGLATEAPESIPDDEQLMVL